MHCETARRMGRTTHRSRSPVRNRRHDGLDGPIGLLEGVFAAPGQMTAYPHQSQTAGAICDQLDAPPSMHADQPMQVLHVEDDSDVVQVVASILGSGFEVTRAASARQARELLSKRLYDLVILDVGLTDDSGLSVIPMVKRLSRPIPIVVFSGLELDEESLGGIDAALTKSRASNSKLIETVRRAIGRESSRRVPAS